MNQKGFANIVLVVVIVILVGVVGYFVFVKKSEQTAQTPTNTSTKNTESIVDWKTYANSKYGFEFKYPKEWNIEYENWENTVPADAGRDAAGSATQELDFGMRDANGKFLGFKMKVEPILVYNTNIEQYLKDYYSVGIDQFKTTVTMGGETAYSLNKVDKGNGIQTCTTYLVANKKYDNNGGQTILAFDRCIGNSEFDSILSTIKFTN